MSSINKPAEDFVRGVNSGKTWAAQARDHKVKLEKLEARLDRLEKTLTSTTEKKEKNRRDKK